MTRTKPSGGRRTAGRRLIGALREAIAINRGEIPPAAVSRRFVTARTGTAVPPLAVRPRDVRAIRERLELSQSVFAAALNVSAETVRAWEQGKQRPGGPAARLLEITRKHPSIIKAAVRRRGTARAGAARSNARHAR